MSTTGFTNGYQSLLNISTFDNIDIINAGNVTVNDSLSLPYVAGNSILLTDSSSNVIGSTLTNGQVLIGSTSHEPVASTISGTTNQINITNASGSITLSTPQNIDQTASPTFNDITLSSLTASQPVHTDASKKLISGLISLTADVTGVLPITKGGTNSSSALLNGNLMISSGGKIVEGPSYTAPTFSNITDLALTGSLVSSSAAGLLQNTTITNSNGSNGSFSGSTLTLSNQQNLTTAGSPQWVGLTLTG